MSKKDYVAIAKVVRESLKECRLLGEWQKMVAMAERLATVFAESNSHFDRGRFLQACGVYE